MRQNDRLNQIARPLAVALLLAGVVGTTAPALAADEQNLSSGLTAEGSPLALHGYDPVAYFTLGEPTRGSAEHAVVYEGATYYFATASHKKLFAKDAAKYAPSFGGYCAFGVSVGKKFDGNPHYWTVANDRLHLNLNADIEEMFRKDVAGAVAKAEGQWRKIEHRPVSDL